MVPFLMITAANLTAAMVLLRNIDDARPRGRLGREATN